MILSRTLAKRRMAAGVRPGWGAAWVPVMFDLACLVVVFLALFGPFRTLTETFNFPVWGTVAAGFALGFIPIQAVLIFSSLWATRSRWTDKDTDQ